MARFFIDLTGQRFSKLLVIKRNTENTYYGVMWDCVCDCGNNKSVNSSDLKRCKVSSCGCERLKHGHSVSSKKSRTYTS